MSPDAPSRRSPDHLPTYRRRSRLARIRLRHPGTPRPPISAPITVLFPALRTPASYTSELAMELLNGTGELPAGKRALHIILREHRRALHIILREHRRALHDLATSGQAGRQPATR